MKLFQCTHCKSPVFFENTRCESCGNNLGYLSRSSRMLSKKKSEDLFIDKTGNTYRYCSNHDYKACNWLVQDEYGKPFCEACFLNRTIPDLDLAKNLKNWRKIELAKHRLVYSLLKLGLKFNYENNGGQIALQFDFLAPQFKNDGSIMTGHLNGLITLNVKEANAAHREAMRQKMSERYRTLLGHFRHEVGHYYWDVLVRPDAELLQRFRSLFGDETPDYGDSLKKYYEQGAPKNWTEHYISKYASSHPWEDWAETWAHYLHIISTLETAFAFGLHLNPNLKHTSHMEVKMDVDPYVEKDFKKLIELYIPLTYAVNSLNRSMGQPDIYPFIVTKMNIEKLVFIHSLIQGACMRN